MAKKMEGLATKYAIIGNSAAAVGAIEAIRAVDYSGSITLVSNEPHHVYSRPLISEYLAGETTIERMAYRPADFYEKNRVEAVLGVAATRIDENEKAVELNGGRRVEYDKLLVATGGKPFVPPIGGLGKADVFTFTTLDDAMALDKAVERIGRFVVVGGGLIGLKCAESLRKRGAEVAIVELADRVMAAVLDLEAGRIVERALDSTGIEVITGDTVEEVLGTAGPITGVRLKSGRDLSCQGVVIAIGVAPNTDLVMETAIKVNRGILVDDTMAASVPGIYAAGDVAEGPDALTGEARVFPIWPNAYRQGRTAGLAMAGEKPEFIGGLSMNSIELFGTPVVNVGITDPRDEGYEILSRASGDVYRKIVLKGNRLVGAIVVGEIDRAGLLTGLIRDGTDVSAVKEELLRSDFGHLDLPDEIREGRLYAV